MHRKREHLHMPRSFGERAADVVANGMGSWRFIIIQTVIVAVWMTLNVVGFVRHWDEFPFILLNLLFSTQAAYAAPIIMMSQNRQAAIDRRRDDHEAEEVDELHALTREIHRLTLEQDEVLAQQTEILTLMRRHIAGDMPPIDTVSDH